MGLGIAALMDAGPWVWGPRPFAETSWPGTLPRGLPWLCHRRKQPLRWQPRPAVARLRVTPSLGWEL